MWVTLIDFLMLRCLCLRGERHLLMIPDSIYSYFIEDFFTGLVCTVGPWTIWGLRMSTLTVGFLFLCSIDCLKSYHTLVGFLYGPRFFFSPMVIVYLGALNCPCLLYQIIFFYKSFLILSIICCFGNNVFLQLWFSYSILGWLIFSSAA